MYVTLARKITKGQIHNNSISKWTSHGVEKCVQNFMLLSKSAQFSHFLWVCCSTVLVGNNCAAISHPLDCHCILKLTNWVQFYKPTTFPLGHCCSYISSYVTLCMGRSKTIAGQYILYCPATREISWYCPGMWHSPILWPKLWSAGAAIETSNLLYSKACNFYMWYWVLYSNNHFKCYFIPCCWYKKLYEATQVSFIIHLWRIACFIIAHNF